MKSKFWHYIIKERQRNNLQVEKAFVSSFAPPPPLHLLHSFSMIHPMTNPLYFRAFYILQHIHPIMEAISSAYGHSQFSMQVLHLLIPIFSQPITL